MKILKYFLILISLIVISLAILLFFASLKDYKPQPSELIAQYSEPDLISDTIEYSILTWNIGYAGLGENMDFFYDGGKKVRDSKERTEENLHAIINTLKLNSQVDFIYLQEVDKESKRTYYINEYDSISYNLSKYYPAFSKNYDVGFVPVPFFSPMGKVVSGITFYSRLQPRNVYKYAFPGNFSWPKRLFMLDRCFITARFRLSSGKDLVLINTHNSTFDKNGFLKKTEMAMLKEFISKEYKKGNFIIAGGDWNQSPPNFKPAFKNFDTIDASYVPSDFITADWHWVCTDSIPTNRRVLTSFQPGKTAVTLIDFFLTSPNIEVTSIKNMNLNFKNSDHNPVIMKFRLKRLK